MKLSKPHLDLGLFTNAREAQLGFWQNEVGLEFDHLGKVGGGIHQLRHHVNGSILKVNHVRDPLPAAPASGLAALSIARPDLRSVRELRDPDGNRVQLVPAGHEGIVGIGLLIEANDPERSMAFYREVLDCAPAGNRRLTCGDTVLDFAPAPRPIERPDYVAPGYRYITLQIFDCDAEHARVLALGGEEGRPPRTIGSTTRYSFVRDPDGNWIELSDRFELTGGAPRG